jgi:hypothetical protein
VPDELEHRSRRLRQLAGVRLVDVVAGVEAHVGSLWATSGTRLATATFTNETASGTTLTVVQLAGARVLQVTAPCPAGPSSRRRR